MGKWKDKVIQKRQVIKGKKRTTKLWTKEEEQFLIDNYTALGPDIIAEKLDRSRKGIILKVHNLEGCPRRQDTRKEWIEEEFDFLQDEFGILGTKECALQLGRSPNSVQSQARTLGLTEDERKYWTSEEEELLKQYSQEWCIADLQELLQRSRMSIIRKRQAMNLPTKTDDYKGKDGQFYDSKQEKDVANLLYNAGIRYKRGIKFYYEDGAWFRPDFIVGQVVIEYFGLLGRYSEYDERTEKKKRYFESQNKYILIDLYPDDLRNDKIIEKVKEAL